MFIVFEIKIIRDYYGDNVYVYDLLSLHTTLKDAKSSIKPGSYAVSTRYEFENSQIWQTYYNYLIEEIEVDH